MFRSLSPWLLWWLEMVLQMDEMLHSVFNLRSEIVKLKVRFLQRWSAIEASGCAWWGRVLPFKYAFVYLWWHLSILRLHAHALGHLADVVWANTATIDGFMGVHPMGMRGHGFTSSSRTLWDLWEFVTSHSKPPEGPLPYRQWMFRPFFNTFV